MLKANRVWGFHESVKINHQTPRVHWCPTWSWDEESNSVMVINWSPLEKMLYTKPYNKPGWSTEWWSAFKISTEDLKVESLFSGCMLYTSPAWCSECENLERLSYSFTAQVFDYEGKVGSREWCSAFRISTKDLNYLNVTLIFNMPHVPSMMFRNTLQDNPTLLLHHVFGYSKMSAWWMGYLCTWHSLGRSSCMGPKDMFGDTGILCHCL